MRITTLWMFIFAGACYSLAGTAQADEDPVAGKYKFFTCTGCHGIPGYTNVYPTYHVPKLGGQHTEYLIAALKDYQISNRDHDTMHANATPLSEQDMADIAAYLANIASSPTGQTPARGNPAAGREKSAACQACHGADGNSSEPQFPRLAGQYADYLVQAMRDYQSGARKNPLMNDIAAGLSPQDIADLAAFYASQKNGLAVVQ